MRSFKLLIVIAALGAAAALALGLGVTSAQSNVVTNGKHFFYAQGQNTPTPDQAASDIIYHGGNAGPGAVGVLTKPYAYIVYWGQEWKDGFKTADTDGKLFTSKTLESYVNSFMKGVGGSKFHAVQTQYCRGIAAGATSCAGDPAAEYITNPKTQYKGSWVDATPVPD